MARLNLSPPWNTRVDEITALFKHDPEIHVVYNEEKYDLKLYVDSANKAAALAQLLPEEYDFGNVVLTVEVIPANHKLGVMHFNSNEQLFGYAFQGNEALSFTKTIEGIFSNNLTYIVFNNEVVQYFNDNLADIYGMCSTLYQEIAKNVFGETEGIFFCTDKPDGFTFTLPKGGNISI